MSTQNLGSLWICLILTLLAMTLAWYRMYATCQREQVNPRAPLALLLATVSADMSPAYAPTWEREHCSRRHACSPVCVPFAKRDRGTLGAKTLVAQRVAPLGNLEICEKRDSKCRWDSYAHLIIRKERFNYDRRYNCYFCELSCSARLPVPSLPAGLDKNAPAVLRGV